MCVPVSAAVPLVQEHTADSTHTEKYSCFQGFLQGKLSHTGKKREIDKEIRTVVSVS